MKLNKLFYLLVAVCAIFTSCGDDTTGGEEAVKGYLVVEEKSVSVEFYGGDTIINYYITEAPEGAVPTATASVNWIKDIVAANDEIHFNAELNESNESRVASINVKYGKQSYEVFIRQDAGWEVDVEFTATAINGEYYGTKYGDPNYYVILSTYGTTGYYDLPFVDSYYRLDMFSTTPAGDVLALPQGVYKYDYLAQGVGDSFGGQYSWLFQTLANGDYSQAWYDDGVVMVTDNKVEAYFKFANGKVHHVVYEGSLDLGWLKFEDPDFFSTLTSDMTVNEVGGHLRLVNYGDVFGVGANNWSVSMAGADEMNYNYFMLDVITDDMSTSIDSILGTYTVAVGDVAKNTFLAGALDGTQYVGSWYTGVVDGYVNHGDRAPLTAGTITIAKDGSNYVVTYDCLDDNGHKITGTYSCIDVVDYSSQQ